MPTTSEIALAVGITAVLVACSKSEAPAPATGTVAAPMAVAASGGMPPTCTAPNPVNILAAALPATGSSGTITVHPVDVPIRVGTDAEIRWRVMPAVAASGIQFVAGSEVVLVSKPPASSPVPASAASSAASATEVVWCFPSAPVGWWAYTINLQDSAGRRWACDPTIISSVGVQGSAAAASAPASGPTPVNCTLQS